MSDIQRVFPGQRSKPDPNPQVFCIETFICHKLKFMHNFAYEQVNLIVESLFTCIGFSSDLTQILVWNRHRNPGQI